MSPMKRYANKQTKARKRPRLNAQERLKQQRAQAQHYIEALHQALKDLDFPDTLDADMAMNSHACVDGTRISRLSFSALCPNDPGSSDCGAWALRCSSPFGAIPRTKAPPPTAAGNGDGSSMILSSVNTANNSASSALGTVASSNGPCPVSMGSSYSSSLAMASSSSRSTLPSVGPIPQAPGGDATTSSP